MRKLLQQALDALEHVQWKNWRTDKAIKALRSELAKPEPEPVAWVYLPNKELLWPAEVEATNPIELDAYKPLYTKEQL